MDCEEGTLRLCGVHFWGSIAPSDVIPNHTKPIFIMMTATHDTSSSGSFPENMARHVFMQLVEGPLARTAAHCPG